MSRIFVAAVLLKAICGQQCAPGGAECINNLVTPPMFVPCCPGLACLTAGGLLGYNGYCVDVDSGEPGECAGPGQKCVDYDDDGLHFEVRAIQEALDKLAIQLKASCCEGFQCSPGFGSWHHMKGYCLE